MSTPLSRPMKSPSRSPNRRAGTPKNDQTNSTETPTKSDTELPRPPSASRLIIKKTSQTESKTVDIAANRSGSKVRKSVVSSRLSTPRANQMAPSTDNASRRSASTPKNTSGRSARSGTPSNKSVPSNKISATSSKTSTPKAIKVSAGSTKTTEGTSKPSKGPSVRKITPKATGTLSKKDSKDESKLSPKSGGLSRAQKAEEKHRKRVTLAQGSGKAKGLGGVKANSSSLTDPHMHRRSSVSRAQRLAYIAKTRTARSSTQGFSNVEGDEAMAMADAIMGAIGTSQEEEEEEEDRGEMLTQWQKKLDKSNTLVSPSSIKSKKSDKGNDEDDDIRMVKSKIMPSFSHLKAGSPRVKNKKTTSLETFNEHEASVNPHLPESEELEEKEEQITPRAHRSATTSNIGDDAYQTAVSNALKTTGHAWGRFTSAAKDIASVRKARSLSVATGDTPTRKGISWTFIDDAMEALTPSRKNQNPQSPTPRSPELGPHSPTSPKSVDDWSTNNEDTLVYQGWLQVHEMGSLFSTGWRRRYLMLIRGGRQGSGPRGLGSLLILRKEPTPSAITSLVKPKSYSEGATVHNKDLCKEISLRGADLALHYEKVPSGTFGFLLTHTLGGDLPLTAPSREVRQLWLTELRKVLKRSNSDREGDNEEVSIGIAALRGKTALSSPENSQWERERSAVSMPRPPPSLNSPTIRSPLTITPRNSAVRSRPDISLQVEVENISSDGISSPNQTGETGSSSPTSPSTPSSFRGSPRGNDRSRSAPSQRPPGNGSPISALNSPTLTSSSAAPLQWRERMRRAAPARIEELDWDNLVAVATPDDFKDLGSGAGVSSVIVANTGGAVFFAFFRNKPGRNRGSDSSRNRPTEVSSKALLSKSINTVEESDERDSDDESSRNRGSISSGQSGAIRSRVRAKNTLAKGPSVRSSRNSTDIEKLVNFGDLDLDLENEDDFDDSTIMEREDEEDSEEDDDDEEGVLEKTVDFSDEDEEDEEDDLTEQVCILKFCRNLMDTQAEFCANQMAMALHIQVPSCRVMRKKDEEWDQIAAATFDLRRNEEQDPGATTGCEALEESLNDTSCGLVFELVHTGCSLKLEHITSTLQLEKDREDAAANELAAAAAKALLPSQPPTLLQMRGSSQSSSFAGDNEHTSRLNTASAVEALHLDPIRLGLPASTSFQSPPIAAALTGGVFNHRRQTLISSGGTGTLVSNNSFRVGESMTDRAQSAEEDTGDFREEYLEKAIGEIVGETLVFDIMIRNPDRFPCVGLGWRGNLDNVMWVNRSPFSGTRTLWVIDSSIPRRPLRLHVRDDKTAIPNLLKQALLGQSFGRNSDFTIHPDDEKFDIDLATRTTSSLLYALVGGNPHGDDEVSRRDLLLFDKQVPAFRRGIRRSLHRCRVLLEKSLHPLHTTLQNYFDEISVELETLAKKKKEKSEMKEEDSSKAENKNKESFANVATAAMKKADEEKPKSKARPGGGFRQRFNTGDVRMFNLKKEEREALEDSDDESEVPPPPPPSEVSKVTPPSERLTPVISQMGRKWVTEAKNRDRSGSKPLEMLRTEVKEVEEKAVEINERDATVIVINNWTRKFWETGKALEARFEEYAIAQMDYEQQLLAASEQLTEKQQELLETADLGAMDQGGDYPEKFEDGQKDGMGHIDDETAARAASLAEAAAATTELMRHEPEPVFVTGFIDSGSTNCFAGAYELKIRLEHVNNRLRILLKTLDEIGDEEEEWE